MKKSVISLIIGLVLIASIIGVIFIVGIPGQSILSLSKVQLVDGKAYWLLTASANNIDETSIFTYNPSTYTTLDGTQIKPKDSLVITFSKQESQCVYQAQKIQKSFLGLDRSYYILQNPEREANILIFDGNGQQTTLDATLVQSKTIKDIDGKGSLTIETQGILAGKTDCPNYENVAIVWNSGNPIFYEKSDYELKLSSNARKNNIFPSSFDSFPTFNGGELRGDINIGNGVFTITADQDYFDSVVISPSKVAKPKITEIIIPEEIKEDTPSTMKVIIENDGDDGNIIIEAESDAMSINPSSTNILLRDSKTISYTLQLTGDIGSQSVKVTACSGNQFGEGNCDTKTKSFKIVSGDTGLGYCGDGICQLFESKTTCASDCGQPDSTEQVECKWYQDYYTKDSFLLGQSQGCRLSLWLIVSSILLGLIIILALIIGIRKATR